MDYLRDSSKQRNRATAFSLAAFGGNRHLVNMLLDKAQPTFDEIEKAVVESCLGGHPSELMDIKTYKNSRYTIKREGKQKRLQIPSVISKLGSLTPYILNPTHTFRNTNVKQYNKNKPNQDNKKEVKELYTVSIN